MRRKLIQTLSILYAESKEYDLARDFLQRGITYCQERDLDSSKNYQLYLKSKILLETGRWNESVSIAESLLQNPEQPGTIKIGCLIILATIRIRRGQPGALEYLNEARNLAFKTKEHQRIIPVMIASLEYEWLTSTKIITEEDLKVCMPLVQKVDNIFLNSVFSFWLKKARGYDNDLAKLYEPYKWVKAGKITMAVAFWEKAGCPFEKALALFEGNEENKKEALLIFQQLNADAVSEAVKNEDACLWNKKNPERRQEKHKNKSLPAYKP